MAISMPATLLCSAHATIAAASVPDYTVSPDTDAAARRAIASAAFPPRKFRLRRFATPDGIISSEAGQYTMRFAFQLREVTRRRRLDGFIRRPLSFSSQSVFIFAASMSLALLAIRLRLIGLPIVAAYADDFSRRSLAPGAQRRFICRAWPNGATRDSQRQFGSFRAIAWSAEWPMCYSIQPRPRRPAACLSRTSSCHESVSRSWPQRPRQRGATRGGHLRLSPRRDGDAMFSAPRI